jgi:hypothetical protein
MSSTTNFLYLLEDQLKKLDQDEIIGIFDQAKARHPELQEAMVNVNIDIYEIFHENLFLISSV